jgi:dihydrofolate reductase
MRTVTYGAACSLDGFIARRDGGVDWLKFTDDARAVMAEYWPRIDTLLMGRKTWEAAAKAGGGGSAGGIQTYVFSRTLTSVPAGATLVREDAADFVRRLKATPGKEICVMGGGELARALLAAGVVDEVGLNVHPVLLGDGVPFLPPAAGQVDLELAECRAMAGGCVLLRYRTVAPVKAPAKSTAKSNARRR